VPIKTLSELALVNGNSIDKPDDPDTLVPYIGLPECNQTEVREVAMRPYREVKGRSVIRPGDILFARIEPSIFNKKYVLVDDLKGHEYAYTSTEFYVVSHRPGISVTEFLYAMFFCSFVYSQSKGKTTGSSGRRRLDPNHFRSLRIPAPELSLQRTIANEAVRRREEARRLHSCAETVWRDARELFEQQLLQGGKS
jgi:type I restriction enzyme S subunit